MRDVKVLISAALPRGWDQNANLQGYVTTGFRTVLGEAQAEWAPYELAPARVAAFRPQLVLACGSCHPDQCEYLSLRRACDRVGAAFAFWLTDDPYEFDATAKVIGLVDHLFTNDLWASFHHQHPSVRHLPLAACPSLAREPARDPGPDVFFCGVGFPNRGRLLEELAPVLAKYRTEVYGSGWDTARLPFARNERIPAEELPDRYAAARAILNVGRSLNLANRRYQLPASTPGPRTFEAAMAGSCQLVYGESLEILDYFAVGDEVLLFDDPPEFERCLRRLRDDPGERHRIAAAARARCLKDHTYACRARTILAHAGLAPVSAAG
jgi:spore maturation protein CgeB